MCTKYIEISLHPFSHLLAISVITSSVLDFSSSSSLTSIFHRHITYLCLGSSVPTNNQGSIVSFAFYENGDPVFERSNARHDFYLSQLRKNSIQLAKFTGSHGRPALLQSHRNAVKGAKGPCTFRSLSRFDVGHSFLFDSLHNLYLGLFVSTL